MTVSCWVCGCPSFVVPCRVDASVTFRFDGDGPQVMAVEPSPDPAPEYVDEHDDGPVCVACSTRLYDDPSLRQSELDAVAAVVRRSLGAR